MKLAIVCPVGPLDRYGYQNVAAECIASMARLADVVYLILSTREMAGLNEMLVLSPKITAVSNKYTWFKEWNGGEFFDIYQVIGNAERGRHIALDDGADCVMLIECNQYIPEHSIPGLRATCEWTIDNAPFGWYYRGDFLAGQMFHANLHRPWIIPAGSDWSFWLDSARCGDTTVKHTRGNWPEEDQSMIVDAGLEMTLEDYAAKINWVRCYSDLEPARGSKFKWEYWHSYMLKKYRNKEKGGELDEIGKVLAGKVKDDYVSSLILAEL